MADRKKYKSVMIKISVAFNLFILSVLFLPLNTLMTNLLVQNEEVVSNGDISAVVILSAGVNCKGVLDYDTLLRLNRGLELFRKNREASIICSGGVRAGERGKTIAVIMKEQLIKWSVPEDKILIQDQTINTYNDMNHLAGNDLSRKIDLNRAVFVTSPYHTLRVRMVLNKLGVRGVVTSGREYMRDPNHITGKLEIFRKLSREFGALIYFKIYGYI